MTSCTHRQVVGEHSTPPSLLVDNVRAINTRRVVVVRLHPTKLSIAVVIVRSTVKLYSCGTRDAARYFRLAVTKGFALSAGKTKKEECGRIDYFVLCLRGVQAAGGACPFVHACTNREKPWMNSGPKPPEKLLPNTRTLITVCALPAALRAGRRRLYGSSLRQR